MSLETPTPTVEATPPLRIVLVEDDEFDVAVFGRAFRQSGLPCEIIRCRRGEEVIEGLRDAELSFDLLVADHQLPGIAGFELCVKLLEEDPPFALVLLTGGGSEQMAIRALRAGIHDYIVKDASQRYLDLLSLVLPRVAQRHRDRHRKNRSQPSGLPQSTRLSLAECALVVRQRGGKIWVEDTEGRKPTLHFSVQLAQAEVEAWTKEKQPVTHGHVEVWGVDPADDQGNPDAELTLTMILPDRDRPRRVLIAHPNPLVTFVATRFVERAGGRAIAVTNGRQAIEALAHETFDAVMMGARMPVLDGIEATRHIREHEDSVHLPIIALATDPTTEEATTCLRVGMDAAVVRPIDFPSLSAALVQVSKVLQPQHQP